jgi:hypothetical protein
MLKESMPRTKAVPKRIQKIQIPDFNDDDPCSICLSKFEEGEKLAVTQCSHVFHQNCLKEWLETSEKCPLCNTIIAPKPIYVDPKLMKKFTPSSRLQAQYIIVFMATNERIKLFVKERDNKFIVVKMSIRGLGRHDNTEFFYADKLTERSPIIDAVNFLKGMGIKKENITFNSKGENHIEGY